MDATTAIIIIALALVILAIVGALYARRRRTSDLRARFGPEYDRTLRANRSQRAAEDELAARQRRAAELTLRSLSEEERLGFAEGWAALQRRFVDDPVGSVREAHSLLEEMMNRRGYPTRRFDEEVELLSVHHPAAVQHYRAAHELHFERGDGEGTTEEHRQAMIHYRALFEELLEVPQPGELPQASEDRRDLASHRDHAAETRP